MAKILCAWFLVNNPGRKPEQEDLNLTVGGTLQLNGDEVQKLAAEAGGLLPVNASVWDEDSIFDDNVYENPNPLMLGVHNTDPTHFAFPVVVPHKKLTDTEPGWEHYAEIYLLQGGCSVPEYHQREEKY